MTDKSYANNENTSVLPGVCIPWGKKQDELGEIMGDPEVIKKEWEQLDVSAYMFLWWWVQR